MEIEKILSISGKSGLYYLLGQSRGGVIVESLTDGKRFPVGMTRNISALSDIAIYTYSEEKRLVDIFRSMKEVYGDEAVSAKMGEKALMEEFRKVLSDFDEDRVYPSHVKKLFGWYEALRRSGKLEAILSEEDTEDAVDQESTDSSEEE